MKKFEKKTVFGRVRHTVGSIEDAALRYPNDKQFKNQTVGELAQHILDCHAEIDRQSKTINRQSRRLEKRSLILKAAQITSDVNERAIRSAESALHEKDEQIKEYGLFRSDLLNVVGSYDEDLSLFSTDMEIVDAIKKLVSPAERVWISSETHPTFPASGLYIYYHTTKLGQLRSFGIFTEGEEVCINHEYHLALPASAFPEPPKPKSQPLEVKVGKYSGAGRTYTVHNVINGFVVWTLDDIPHPNVNSIDLFIKEIEAAGAVFIGGGNDA